MSKAIEVIRSPEDIAQSLDRRLVFAYLQTCYRVLQPPFDLRVGELNFQFDQFLGKNGATRWAFITPENPRSQLLPADENSRRCQIFLEKIAGRGYQFFDGMGIGAGGDWLPERSFLILEISPKAAVALATEFDQNAIVFGKKGAAPELWWLAD